MDTNHIVLEIDAEIARLRQARSLLAGTNNTWKAKPQKPAGASVGNTKPRRTLSAGARARISAAQKARWAKSKRVAKKTARNPAVASASKKPTGASLRGKSTPKRTLSAEARSKIAAAQKARWAKLRKTAKKAAGSTRSPAARNGAIPAKAAKRSAPAKKGKSAKQADPEKATTPVAPPTPASAQTS